MTTVHHNPLMPSGRHLLSEDIIRALVERRGQRSVTVARLSSWLGYESETAVREWEAGRRYPRIDSWIAWCSALDWTPAQCLAAAARRREQIANRKPL